MVEYTAHNGNNVGSSPTKLIATRLYLIIFSFIKKIYSTQSSTK